MREPEKITKTAIQTLKKKYGYTDKQIRLEHQIKKMNKLESQILPYFQMMMINFQK